MRVDGGTELQHAALGLCVCVCQISVLSSPACDLLPRAHAQGVKRQSVVVVVGTKIARSRVLGICACCKYSQSVDIDEKVVCTCFEFLKKA